MGSMKVSGYSECVCLSASSQSEDKEGSVATTWKDKANHTARSEEPTQRRLFVMCADDDAHIRSRCMKRF